MEPIMGTFHDAETGETIIRELTDAEIAAMQSIRETDDDAEQPA